MYKANTRLSSGSYCVLLLGNVINNVIGITAGGINIQSKSVYSKNLFAAKSGKKEPIVRKS